MALNYTRNKGYIIIIIIIIFFYFRTGWHGIWVNPAVCRRRPRVSCPHASMKRVKNTQALFFQNMVLSQNIGYHRIILWHYFYYNKQSWHLLFEHKYAPWPQHSPDETSVIHYYNIIYDKLRVVRHSLSLYCHRFRET